ncbi:MAG: hypothetical protein WBE86_07190 [Candidatus Acidiferrales bacterium]
MLDSFANYFWQHPATIIAAAIAVIIVLIWMTGSGSRQRFISFQRTKETDQLARDLSRIAAALERIARNQETPTDYVGRPIPPTWEASISAGAPAEEIPAHMAEIPGNGEPTVPVGVDRTEAPAVSVPPVPTPVRESGSSANPPGGATGLLGGKKKLDLPNPLYRPK